MPEPTPGQAMGGFQGWYTLASGGSQITSSTIVNLSDNQTLYAHWGTSGSSIK